MLNEFLTSVSGELQNFASELDIFSIGNSIRFHSDVEEGAIVLLGVREIRERAESYDIDLEFNAIRKNFYQLKKGNWQSTIYDLGDLYAGATREDTYFAFLKIQEELLKKKCIIITMGGTPDLSYSQFRAFDSIQPHVNLTCIDNRFRLGNDAKALSANNYLSKIITQEPHSLFEYVHLGYQTYFVAQEELDLMEQLNFDVKRLGKLTEFITEAEPELRNSNMVVLNLDSIQSSDFKSTVEPSPNGFSSREICALARYTGINNKVQSFSVYNYKVKNIPSDEMLIAEILWYFIEGKNHTPKKLNFDDNSTFETYFVQMQEQDLVFYYDVKAEQWWLKIGDATSEPNEKEIIPCSERDYKRALKGKIPERWWKSYKKLY